MTAQPSPSASGAPQRLAEAVPRRDRVSTSSVGGRSGSPISGVVIVAGLVALGLNGLNLGIDFKGGNVWQTPAGHASVADVRSAMEDVGLKDVRVQKLTGGERRVAVPRSGRDAQGHRHPDTDQARPGGGRPGSRHRRQTGRGHDQHGRSVVGQADQREGAQRADRLPRRDHALHHAAFRVQDGHRHAGRARSTTCSWSSASTRSSASR